MWFCWKILHTRIYKFQKESVIMRTVRWLLACIAFLGFSACESSRVSVKDLHDVPIVMTQGASIELHIPYLKSISGLWVNVKMEKQQDCLLFKGFFSNREYPRVWRFKVGRHYTENNCAIWEEPDETRVSLSIIK